MQPVRPAPSFLEAIAGLVGTGLQAHTGAQTVRRQNEADARARRREAIDLMDRTAENAAAQALPEILRPSEVDPATARAVGDARSEAGSLAPMATAVNQGRQTRDGMELRIEMRLRDLISRHPNSAAAIVDVFRENGLMSPLMREYNEASEDLDDERDFLREDRQATLTIATQTLGLTVTPENEAQALEAARTYRRGMVRMEEAERQLNMQRTQQSMTTEQRQEAERDYSRNALAAFQDQAAGEIHAFGIAITQLMNDPRIPDATKQTELARIVGQVESGVHLRVQEFLAQRGAYMNEEQREEVRQFATGYVNQMRELITGDNSLVNQRMRTLQLIQTDLNIQANEALPLYSQIRQLIGSQAASDAFITSMLGNEQVRSRLAREMQNFGQLGANEQRTRISNVARMLSDANVDIRHYDAREARLMLRDHILPTLQALRGNANVRNGRDVEGHKAATLGIMQLSNAAVEATPQWGVETLANLANTTLTGSAVTQILFDATANRQERELAIHAYVPALQQVHDALRNASTGDNYYRAAFDRRHNRWVAARTNTPLPAFRTTGTLGGDALRMQAERAARHPLQTTLRQVDALNRSENVLMNISVRGFDRAVPREGITDVERRRFYALGIPPAAMTQERANQGENSSLTRLRELGEHVGEWINELPETPRPGRQGAATEELDNRVTAAREDPQRRRFVEETESVAAEHGVPNEIALRLIARESTFRPGAISRNPGGNDAIGLGQVTVNTAALYGVSRQELERMPPRENLRFAFRILMDNYRRFGNWEDALSAYHSGVSLSQARRQNRRDTNMATTDYVAGIAG